MSSCACHATVSARAWRCADTGIGMTPEVDAARLRAVLSGRPVALVRVGRRRAWPQPREVDRRSPSRHHRRPQPAGRRLDLQRDAAWPGRTRIDPDAQLIRGSHPPYLLLRLYLQMPIDAQRVREVIMRSAILKSAMVGAALLARLGHSASLGHPGSERAFFVPGRAARRFLPGTTWSKKTRLGGRRCCSSEGCTRRRRPSW